jgi:hypothetical protein|tara:strand:+ start:297 stop:533 length:237 start_codon:yes stop_codon:yes gene_type:complete
MRHRNSYAGLLHPLASFRFRSKYSLALKIVSNTNNRAAPVAAPAPANCHKISRKSATALVRGFYKAGPEKPVENGMKR